MNDLEYKINYLTHMHNDTILDYEINEEESKELQLTNLFLADKETIETAENKEELLRENFELLFLDKEESLDKLPTHLSNNN